QATGRGGAAGPWPIYPARGRGTTPKQVSSRWAWFRPVLLDAGSLSPAAQPVAGPRFCDVRRIVEGYGDGVEAGLILVARVVADDVLAADLGADALHRVLEAPLFHERELAAASSPGEYFGRAIDK